MTNKVRTDQPDAGESASSGDDQQLGADTGEGQMAEVICSSSHAVDLADGSPLSPGETATIDVKDTHNAALVADGHLLLKEGN